jgi:hypothetical protein
LKSSFYDLHIRMHIYDTFYFFLSEPQYFHDINLQPEPRVAQLKNNFKLNKTELKPSDK